MYSYTGFIGRVFVFYDRSVMRSAWPVAVDGGCGCGCALCFLAVYLVLVYLFQLGSEWVRLFSVTRWVCRWLDSTDVVRNCL